ncbi:flagellar filament capping protein FliD [Sporohalobacter salinus]|uniref:flagellar filament capping protein FliD n=1 Tax=Sporohalobacter salinus TaxID=1494606 RepID=UPI001960905F|nr:flagellar filament capping protein FliD [Sporohalobacter salinus]MBM7623036.1 flagellar hook-associated protein 2 [Sporohalobacter salinus]
MADLGISGLVSGMDTDQKIYNILSSEFNPQFENLTQEKSELTTTKDAWRDVNSRLDSLSNKITDLKFSSTFNSNTVKSSDEDIVTGTANSDAVANNYDIDVSNLAQAHSVVSDQQSDSDTALGLNSGTFALDIGGKTITVGDDSTIDSNTTLNEVADYINSDSENDDGSGNKLIEASVVDNKLVLESAETGTSNTMSISSDADGILSQLGLTDFSTDLSNGGDRIQQAEDAQFTVDGVSVTRESNTDINDVISNVTFDLHSSGSATLDVGPDTEKSVTAIQEFVDQYNSTMSFIDDKSNYNEDTEEAGPLQGDSTLARLTSNLRQTITSDVDSTNKYNDLSMVGIEIKKDGEMTFDKDQFKSALNEAPEEVKQLFNADKDSGDSFNGVAVQLDNYVDNLVKTGGVVPDRVDFYEDRIGAVEDEIDSLRDRMQNKKDRLEAQFTEMETAMAEMNNQSSYMQSMLSGMGSSSVSTLLGSL